VSNSEVFGICLYIIFRSILNIYRIYWKEKEFFPNILRLNIEGRLISRVKSQNTALNRTMLAKPRPVAANLYLVSIF
jgi:hypothetical protein